MSLRRALLALTASAIAAAMLVPVPASALVTGGLDTTFGTGGTARVDLSKPSIDVANGLGAGLVGSANGHFARSSTNPGTGSGRATVVVDFGVPSVAYGAASANDGILVGSAGDDFAVARLTPERNALVAGFGDQGRVRTSFGRPAVARGVAYRIDDSYVAGVVGLGADSDIALTRYDGRGRLVPTFGTGGVVVADLSGGADAAYAVRNDTRSGPDALVVAGRAGGAALVGRYLPDGTWDPTFGVGGRALVDLTPGDDIAYGLAMDQNGGIVVAGTAGTGAFVARLTASGTLDPTFGTGGAFLTDLGPGGRFTSVDLGRLSRGDGYTTAVIAGGTLVTPSGTDGVVVRLTDVGQLDPRFATGGRAVVDFGGTDDQVNGVNSGTDGAAMLVGGDGADMRVAWLDGAGQPTALAEGGVSRAIDFSTSSEFGQAMVVQPDGAIVVVGFGNPGLVITRFRPDGRLDTGFGRAGAVVEPGHEATSVALQADGKIIVGGSRGLSLRGVSRYWPDGRIDTAFGNTFGFASVPGLTGDIVGAVAVRPDGRIVVGTRRVSVLSSTGLVESQVEMSVEQNRRVIGLAVDPTGGAVAVLRPVTDVEMTSGPALVRVRADGTRDPDFHGYVDAWPLFLFPRDVVRLPDGRFVLVAEIPPPLWTGGHPSRTDMGVVAFTPDGRRDLSFGGPQTQGVVRLDVCQFDRPADVTLAPDGKIVVALSCYGDSSHIALARFHADGQLDTSFAARGTWVGDFVGAPTVSVEPDGRVLVAGWMGEGNQDIVVQAIAQTVVASGRLRTWGFSGLGQPGVGNTRVIAAAGRTFHTLAVTQDMRVTAAGWNIYGQLGDGTTTDSNLPKAVAGLTNVVAVAAGTYHSVALRGDGTVWTWGLNSFGMLGDGTLVDRRTPVQVPGLTQVTSISAGALHTIALRADGTTWAWGWNGLAQLATGTKVDSRVPFRTAIPAGVTALAAGDYHSLFLFGDGDVMSAGWDAFGQLGHWSDDGVHPSHVNRSGLINDRYVAIAAGGLHSLGVRVDGTVWAWGWNGVGQLGDGSTVDRRSPVQVEGITNALTVVAGTYHSLVLGRDGVVKAWGWNLYDQLGSAPSTHSPVPVVVTAIPTGTVVTGIAANALHGLAY